MVFVGAVGEIQAKDVGPLLEQRLEHNASRLAGPMVVTIFAFHGAGWSFLWRLT